MILSLTKASEPHLLFFILKCLPFLGIVLSLELLLSLLIFIQISYAWENNALAHISQSLATRGNLTDCWIYHQCPRTLTEYQDPLALAISKLTGIPPPCLVHNSSILPAYCVCLLKSTAPFPCLVNRTRQNSQQFLRNICSKGTLQLPGNIRSSKHQIQLPNTHIYLTVQQQNILS